MIDFSSKPHKLRKLGNMKSGYFLGLVNSPPLLTKSSQTRGIKHCLPFSSIQTSHKESDVWPPRKDASNQGNHLHCQYY